MKEFLESIIRSGKFNLDAMEKTIMRNYLRGDLTEAEEVELLELAAEMADGSNIDLPAVLADFEQRISALESAGIVVWKSGMSTAKGQTVLYDIIKEGRLRYCRYDGGRSATSLSPGKIEGWVILAAAGGAVTHTVEKDEHGNIILVPVEDENSGNT